MAIEGVSVRRGTSGLRGIDRLLDVLKAFGEAPAWTLRDLSGRCDLPASTLHRLLKGLKVHHYVESDPERGVYHAGPALIALASRVLSCVDVRTYARPVMQELRDLTGESVSLDIVIDGGYRVCIEQFVARQSIKHMKPLGTPLPLHAGGPGKCLLAFMPDEEVEKVIAARGLPRLCTNTVTDPVVLRRELQVIRERGYSVARDEREVGAAGVAAPIRDHDGNVAATLGIGCITQRFTPELEALYARYVEEGALRISRTLGYCPPNGTE